MTGIDQRHLQPLGGHGLRFHEAVIGEVGNRRHARAGEFGEIAVVVIAAPGFVRPGDGITGQHGETGQLAGQRRQAADAERIEPPQRVHQRQDDERGADHVPAQVRKDREQVGRGVAVDHHQVDEVRGHLHDVVLEPRQQHQQHDQRQRQRARQRRAPQQRDKEEVQNAPRQRKTHAAAEIGFGLQHDRQRGHVRCRNSRKPPEADGGKAGGKGGSGGPWIWRGRHGRKRNMTRRNAKPWLATTRRRTTSRNLCRVIKT